MKLILALLVVLISYGSLYPLKFSGDAPSVLETLNWLVTFDLHTTRVDIVANILLFVPFGFIARLCINPSRNLMRDAAGYFIFGCLLAFLIQYLQWFLPARIASAMDAILNTVGILLGMLLSHSLIVYAHNHLTSDHSQRLTWSTISLPILLASIWLIWRWFPLIPMLSSENIMTSLMPLFQQTGVHFTLLVRDTVGWLVFLYLISRPPFDKGSNFRLIRILVFCLGLELFIVNNGITVNDFLAVLVAFAIYVSIAHQVIERALLWLILLTLPLVWTAELSFNTNTLDFRWLPFTDILKGNPWMNAELQIVKLFFSANLIYQLQQRWRSWGTATLASGITILLLGVGQKFIGGNSPDITDTLLTLVAGWIMYQVETQASEERNLAMR